MKKKYCNKQDEIKKSILAENRKSLREDSLDDPDVNLTQAFKGRDLEILEAYQRATLSWLEDTISYELESRGFKRVRFFSKDGYKFEIGSLFSKRVAEPGSRILLTVEIGEFGKIEANGISYNAEDLANEICKAVDDKTVKIDAVYKAGIGGIDSAQWRIRLYHEVPEDILSFYKNSNSQGYQVGNNPIKESSGRRSYKMFTGRAEDGRVFKGTYISKTHMISCLKPIIGKNAIVTDVADLPQVVTSELLNEYPEYVTLIGGNSTYNYDIFRTIIFKNLGYCVGDRLGFYIVRSLDEVKDALRKSGALDHTYVNRHSPEGKEILWTEAFEWITSKPNSAFLESSSNDKLDSDEKSIVEEIIQADFESGLTSNDYESVLDIFKEDDVLSEKAEAATEYYFELLEYGPAGILEVITDNWSDDYLAEYGEFDDEDYYKDDDDPEEECYDHVEDDRADINSTADWYKISRIEGLIYDSQYKMTVEEAKAKLGIDPSFKYVPTGNLKHPSFEEL